MRPPNPAETRVLQSLRQTNVISKAEMDQCIALLEATETCDRCDGDGNEYADDVEAPWCQKCDGTGQMRVIR
jgi:DnaJ-class molecular chaperone